MSFAHDPTKACQPSGLELKTCNIRGTRTPDPLFHEVNCAYVLRVCSEATERLCVSVSLRLCVSASLRLCVSGVCVRVCVSLVCVCVCVCVCGWVGGWVGGCASASVSVSESVRAYRLQRRLHACCASRGPLRIFV